MDMNNRKAYEELMDKLISSILKENEDNREIRAKGKGGWPELDEMFDFTHRNDHCNWSQKEEEEDCIWSSDCELTWWFDDGSPLDNDMENCPRCRKPIAEIRDSSESEPDIADSDEEDSEFE